MPSSNVGVPSSLPRPPRLTVSRSEQDATWSDPDEEDFGEVEVGGSPEEEERASQNRLKREIKQTLNYHKRKVEEAEKALHLLESNEDAYNVYYTIRRSL